MHITILIVEVYFELINDMHTANCTNTCPYMKTTCLYQKPHFPSPFGDHYTKVLHCSRVDLLMTTCGLGVEVVCISDSTVRSLLSNKHDNKNSVENAVIVASHLRRGLFVESD